MNDMIATPVLSRSNAILGRVAERVSAALERCGFPGSADAARFSDRTDISDFQSNVAFRLAKQAKMPPIKVAERIVAELAGDLMIRDARVDGAGFVNFRLSDDFLAAYLAEIAADPHFGTAQAHEARTFVIDYGGPNVAKSMHVGHLRSTIIGDALVRILRFLGHEVIADNHLGDWGTQFGLLIVGMREFGDAEALAREPIVELERIYKQASERAKDDPAFAAEARVELAKLQAGDAENTALWQRFVEVTRGELDQIYDRLEVRFDTWHGESFYHAMLPGVIELLTERGLVREDQGAQCVFFAELEGAPEDLKRQKEPLIVQKQDGAYLYSTTDLATLRYRHDELRAKRAIYVVDMRQALHFKQVFAVAKLAGWGDMRTEHLGFGSVLGKDGRPLKTRDAQGRGVTLASLLDEAEERAIARLREAQADGKLEVHEEELVGLARIIGIGAVKYADLHQNRASDYQFDFDKMITFHGNAAPYLQYAYARVRSIFRKGQIDPALALGEVALAVREEQALGRVLVRFGEVVHQAAEGGLPHLITDHLYELAKAYSAFFEACPVLKAEAATQVSRLTLCALTARQLQRGLGLLGIQVVERM